MELILGLFWIETPTQEQHPTCFSVGREHIASKILTIERAYESGTIDWTGVFFCRVELLCAPQAGLFAEYQLRCRQLDQLRLSRSWPVAREHRLCHDRTAAWEQYSGNRWILSNLTLPSLSQTSSSRQTEPSARRFSPAPRPSRSGRAGFLLVDTGVFERGHVLSITARSG